MDTAQEDLADWRHRLAHALKAFLHAIDVSLPAAEAVRLDQVIRVLEREGVARGFLPTGGAVG